jgi:hypothetical protein
MALVVAAGGAVAGQRVGEKGWLGAVPTWGYIAALPWMESGEGMKELRKRAESGTMRQWEYRWLVERAVGSLRSSRGARLVERLGIIEEVARLARYGPPSMPYKSWAAPAAVDTVSNAARVMTLLDDQDPDVRVAAVRCAVQLRSNKARTMPALIGRLGSYDPKLGEAILWVSLMDDVPADTPFFPMLLPMGRHDRGVAPLREEREFLSALHTGDAEGDPRLVLSVLIDGLRHRSSAVRCTSAWLLAAIAPEDREIQGNLLSLADDPDNDVRRVLVRYAGRIPLNAQTQEIITNAIRSTDLLTRPVGLWAARQHGAGDTAFLPEVLGALRDSSDVEWDEATRTWISLGGDPAIAAAALVQHVQGDHAGEDALLSLARLHSDLPDTRAAITPCLDSPDTEVRGAAACAYACLGGDIDRATRIVLGVIEKTSASTPFMWTVPSFAHLGVGLMASSGRLSIPQVTEWLASPNADQRMRALAWLRLAGDPTVLPRVRALRSDPDPRVAEAAEEAAKRLEWEVKHPVEAARLRAEELAR